MTAREPRQLFAGVVATAAALAALLVGASIAGARGGGDRPPVAAAPTQFAGIAQHGSTLGSPSAPLTLVEYADLQCPYCGEWARSALPVVVDRYVRTGKLRLVFNGLAFVGPDSQTALRTAIAAGRQGHLWDLVHALYVRQGAENSGWVTDDLIRDVAAGIPGLDTAALLDARDDVSVEVEARRAYDAAQAAGVRSTPSFQLGRTGGVLSPLHVASLDAAGIVPALDEALAQ